MKLIFLLLLFSSFAFAADDDDDRKMTPAELSENTAVIPAPVFPDICPVSSFAFLERGDGECYTDFVKTLVQFHDMFTYFIKETPNSVGVTISILNSATNLFDDKTPLRITRVPALDIASLLPLEITQSRRQENGVNRRGSASTMRIGRLFDLLPISTRRVAVAHELGHAMRAQVGNMSPLTGPLVSMTGVVWQPVGWYREELENTGLVSSRYPFATENAFRREIGTPEITAYGDMGVDMFNRIDAFINANPTAHGMYNFTDYLIYFPRPTL